MVVLSDRLRAVVDALPLRPGLRVLEVGGAPGAAARQVAARVAPGGHVLVLDRSPGGIASTLRACAKEVSSGLMSTECAAVETFDLTGEPFDIAFACRVGALDGRHPHLYEAALERLRLAVKPGGYLFVDTGSPLTRIAL